MPYKRTYGKKRRSTSTFRRPKFTGSYSKVGSRARYQTRLEKAGIDVISKLITNPMITPTANVNLFTFTGAVADAKLAVNPLHQLYTVSTTFLTIRQMYKEYRMKQCKIHIMLKKLSPAASTIWDQSNPLTICYSWIRNSAYTAGNPIAYDVNAIRPTANQKIWTIAIDKPEFWTSITAANTTGETTWMNTAFPPGTSPNLGMCFMPELSLNVLFGAAPANGAIEFSYEMEYLVEFRGSVL